MTIDSTSNQITTAGYGYDANGNMTSDGQNTLTYDAENRAVTSSGSLGSGTYYYDGNGLRVKKVSSSTTTVYVFSGSKMIAEYVNGAAPSSPTREYVYSGATLIAKIESGATQYYQQDHLSARMLTDSSGNKIGEQGHYPYGENWYPQNPATKWQFTSYERDAESGNDYAMAREYVNRLARFSSPDPLGGNVSDPQTLNRYTYALSDPTNLVDPAGLCGWTYMLYSVSVSIGGGPASGGGPELGGYYESCWEEEHFVGFQGPLVGPSEPPNRTPIQGGGGGSGGPSKRQTVNNLRSSLYDALLKDPDCLTFLGSKGGNPLDTLYTLQINFTGAEQAGSIAATVAVYGNPKSSVPTSATTNINETGWFFSYGIPMNLSFGGHPLISGSPRLQAAVLLHELGHATGILDPNDVASPTAQAANNATTLSNCSKTIASFSNTPQ